MRKKVEFIAFTKKDFPFSLGRDFFIWITWKRKIVFKLDNTFFLFIVEDRAIYIILERDRLTSLIIISLI